MSLLPIDYKTAHRASGWHKEMVCKSQTCGCFYCLRIFDAKAIIDWIDEPKDCPRDSGKTAICPYCGIDAVIPDAAGYELTDQFLKAMNEKYF